MPTNEAGRWPEINSLPGNFRSASDADRSVIAQAEARRDWALHHPIIGGQRLGYRSSGYFPDGFGQATSGESTARTAKMESAADFDRQWHPL